MKTAQGALLGWLAQFAALGSGHIATAGLDWFQIDPRGNPPRAAQDNILMPPPIDIATRDRMGFHPIDTLDAILAGQTRADLR